MNYLRDEKPPPSVVRRCSGAGRRAVAIQGDMAQEADVERMFDDASTRSSGALTHLVYNAGIDRRATRGSRTPIPR